MTLPAAGALAFALAFLQLTQGDAPAPEQRHFRFQRTIHLAPEHTSASTHACATLGPEVFSHAAPSLADLRLYDANANELPFALTVSEPTASSTEKAVILNLGTHAGHIVFDLDMPPRPYTDVLLTLNAKDFLATASVSGENPGKPPTQLGTYTLFDLTAQHLSRSTTLKLQESTFPRLHVDLAMTSSPGPPQSFLPAIVLGASVPPSREDQILFTPVAETTSFRHENHHTLAIFQLPARVPVERIAFFLAPGYKANFSRPVQLTAHTKSSEKEAPEQITGEISRVQLTEPSHNIHEENLTVPAILGTNMQAPATVEVSIDDGDDRPLDLSSIRLEMRQRQLCFDPPPTSTTLFYGDPALRAPIYDYARLFLPGLTTRLAALDPEQLNPGYIPRQDLRPFAERHPELLWLALIAVICVLAVLAFRTAHHRTHHHRR